MRCRHICFLFADKITFHYGERSLRRALDEYLLHYHAERNHQGKENVLLFPQKTAASRDSPVQCRERLGGLLRYYHQEAA
jgi:hypothetical protein